MLWIASVDRRLQATTPRVGASRAALLSTSFMAKVVGDDQPTATTKPLRAMKYKLIVA
jgi:hypothetical protein